MFQVKKLWVAVIFQILSETQMRKVHQMLPVTPPHPPLPLPPLSVSLPKTQ